jgi:hypothetical protein
MSEKGSAHPNQASTPNRKNKALVGLAASAASLMLLAACSTDKPKSIKAPIEKGFERVPITGVEQKKYDGYMDRSLRKVAETMRRISRSSALANTPSYKTPTVEDSGLGKSYRQSAYFSKSEPGAPFTTDTVLFETLTSPNGNISDKLTYRHSDPKSGKLTNGLTLRTFRIEAGETPEVEYFGLSPLNNGEGSKRTIDFIPVFRSNDGSNTPLEVSMLKHDGNYSVAIGDAGRYIPSNTAEAYGAMDHVDSVANGSIIAVKMFEAVSGAKVSGL